MWTWLRQSRSNKTTWKDENHEFTVISMKWNNDRKLRLIWNNIAWLLRNDKIWDQSLFIAWGGGGKSEDFGLNTGKYSRFPLQILFNLSDSPSYLLITFVIPSIGFNLIFFRFLLVLYLYVAFFVISFFIQCVLVPWLQLFAHLVQKIKMAFDRKLTVHRDQQWRDHLSYSLRYLTRYLILCYPLHCSTTPFRCLDFSADGNDSELP